MKVLKVYMKFTGVRNRKYALCKCECGKEFELRFDSIKKTRSCGCLRDKQAVVNVKKNHKHKLTGTRIYNIYRGMKQRCDNKNSKSYKNYGGRGIKVCDEWNSDFINFKKWAFNNGYSEELTLDRIDNSKWYSPENCRWSTAQEQARNRRSNVFIKVNGETKTLIELSEKYRINPSAAYSRIRRGSNPEDVFITKKKNSVSGERCHLSKLTEADIKKIREEYSKGASLKKLSEKFKVATTTIFSIVKRKTWKHI